MCRKNDEVSNIKQYLSWGRQFRFKHRVITIESASQDFSFMAAESAPMLPFAYGHTYGDSCLNADGILLDVSALNRIIAFDTETGILRCEAGVRLGTILDYVVPFGWFLPVVPSSGQISVGGAIAHDVHGRNHFREGTFGKHVRKFELVRSDGSRLICSPAENFCLFAATVSGLGLTGLVTWAEIALRRISSPFIQAQSSGFMNLKEFFDLRARSLREHEYHTAWIDCRTLRNSTVRGVFVAGNHEESSSPELLQEKATQSPAIKVPFDMPNWLINRYSAKWFNAFYFFMKKGKDKRQRVRYNPFFYQLDSLGDWNRLLGKRGFLQYHFVLPEKNAEAVSEILNEIKKSEVVPFFAIFHSYGSAVSPGIMSFPLKGLGGTFDCINLGGATLKLFRRLDTILIPLGGRVYPAKDSAMEPTTFKHYYPRWQEFSEYRDPKFSSSFWRRVTGDL